MAEDFLSGLEGGLETGILAGVATGNPILGLAAGGLGVITNLFQSRGRRQDQRRLAQANREAAKYQFAASMRALDMWNGYLSQMTQQFKPWRVAGMAAMDEMMRGIGIVVPEGTFDIGPDWDTGIASGDVKQMIAAVQKTAGPAANSPQGGRGTVFRQEGNPFGRGAGGPPSVTAPLGSPNALQSLGFQKSTFGGPGGGRGGLGFGSPGVGGSGSPSTGFGTAAGAGT